MIFMTELKTSQRPGPPFQPALAVPLEVLFAPLPSALFGPTPVASALHGEFASAPKIEITLRFEALPLTPILAGMFRYPVPEPVPPPPPAVVPSLFLYVVPLGLRNTHNFAPTKFTIIPAREPAPTANSGKITLCGNDDITSRYASKFMLPPSDTATM